jgi:hypothetical protein
LKTLRKTYQSAFYIKFILVRVKCRAVKVLVKICNALCFFPCLFLIDWLIDTVKLVYFGQQWMDGYGSKLLSVCHSKLATDPILWITMTHQECSRCICWNLGWLPVGEPRQCPRHLTCVLARPHVIGCCQIHQKLLPSLFILDSLSFLLNKLPMSLQILSIPLHLFFYPWSPKGEFFSLHYSPFDFVCAAFIIALSDYVVYLLLWAALNIELNIFKR